MWGLGLLVLAARLAVFAYAGSPLPYFDEWVIEFNKFFAHVHFGMPWTETLLIPHNEHLVATTRLLATYGFLLNGYWDVKFLVVVSAAIRALDAMLAFRWLTEDQEPGVRWVTLGACAVVYAAPISGYNLLCGTQVCFFIAHIAAFWSIRIVATWSDARTGALRLIVAMVIGILSLGSAIAIPAATLAVHLATRRRRPGFWWGWGVTAGVAIGRIIQLGSFGLVGRTAESPIEIVSSFLRLLSWPIMNPIMGAGILVGATTWLVLRWREKSESDRGIMFAMGVAAFAATNAAMLAVNRPSTTIHMRHWDTLSLGTLALFAIVAVIANRAGKHRRLFNLGTALLGLTCVIGFGLQIAAHTLPYMRQAHDHRENNLTLYRYLFQSGRIAELEERVSARLSQGDLSFYDDPSGRYVPHTTSVSCMALDTTTAYSILSPDLIPGREKSAVSKAVEAIIETSWAPGLLGLSLISWAVIRHRTARVASTSAASD